MIKFKKIDWQKNFDWVFGKKAFLNSHFGLLALFLLLIFITYLITCLGLGSSGCFASLAVALLVTAEVDILIGSILGSRAEVPVVVVMFLTAVIYYCFFYFLVFFFCSGPRWIREFLKKSRKLEDHF